MPNQLPDGEMNTTQTQVMGWVTVAGAIASIIIQIFGATHNNPPSVPQMMNTGALIIAGAAHTTKRG